MAKIIRSIGPDGLEVISNILDQFIASNAVYKEIAAPIPADFVKYKNIVFVKKFGKHFKRVGDLTPYHFGCKGDGSDDYIPLQLFFDYITTYDNGNVSMEGSFSVSSGLILGPETGRIATTQMYGTMALSALNAIEKLISLRGMGSCVWSGKLSVGGTGSTGFGGRTCAIGIFFDRINPSGRFKIDALNAARFWFGGVVSIGTSSINNLGDIKVTDCGSGFKGFSQTSIWNTPVNSGSSESVNQRTTITVGTLPPAAIINGDYGSLSTSPRMVRINDKLYYIYNVIAEENKLVIYPWLDNTITEGTLDYVFGGGVYLQGADTNVYTISLIDAIRCGTAAVFAPLYLPQVDRLVTQSCGVGLSIGGYPSAAGLGGNIRGLYVENNNTDVAVIARGGDNTYNIIGGEYALSPSKIESVGQPRRTNNSMSDNISGMDNLSFNYKSRWYSREKGANNVADTGTAVAFSINRPDYTLIVNRNSGIISIRTINIDKDINRLFGYDSGQLFVIGNGVNSEPTGTITFTATQIGFTVNGLPSASFSGFTKSAHFVVYWQVQQNNFLVTLI